MKYRPNNGKINYANFADAIIIGARHKQVQMIIKKSFK